MAFVKSVVSTEKKKHTKLEAARIAAHKAEHARAKALQEKTLKDSDDADKEPALPFVETK